MARRLQHGGAEVVGPGRSAQVNHKGIGCGMMQPLAEGMDLVAPLLTLARPAGFAGGNKNGYRLPPRPMIRNAFGGNALKPAGANQ